jgi:NTE family protein
MIPKKQRAFVLQGGGALGAYEAGVFKVLYHWINNQIGEDENIFDVIAGTSAGAINGALLLNHVLDNKRRNPSISTKQSWAESPKSLWNFWMDSAATTTTDNPQFEYWWNITYGTLPNAAPTESARRYYSAKELLFTGARNVFSAPKYVPDDRYFDNLGFPINNGWYRYTNQPLRDLMRKYWNYDQYPLATSFGNREPRLILAAVDVENGETVTFDSYARLQKDENENVVRDENGYGVYHRSTSYNNLDSSAIDYEKGIDVRHVMASASVPIHYDYCVLETVSQKERQFWDGGLISNTPLRELVSEYKTFWQDTIGKENLEKEIIGTADNESLVPDLEVYVANIWPSVEEPAPSDHDGQIDRHNDITFHDKTEYDEKVSVFVTDYIDLTKRLIQLAKASGASDTDLEKLLSNFTLSKTRKGKPRKYKDLLTGRFRIAKVVRIEREDDPNTISQKWVDYSLTTLQKLYDQGHKDTVDRLIKEELMKDVDSLQSQSDVREELGALLTDLTKVLRGHDLDYYYGNMRSKLSGFIDKVIILNRTGKINNTEANEIGMRAAALKSSFED